jgi:hypothetical protein
VPAFARRPPFFKNNTAASERSNTRLEALLIERLGVRFTDRSDTDPSKQLIREIVGLVRASWTTMRAQGARW